MIDRVALRVVAQRWRGAWRDLSLNASTFKESCIITLIGIGMVLEDLTNKIYLMNTFLPMGYWIALINTEKFSISDIKFIFLIVGILLVAIQLFLNFEFSLPIQLGDKILEIQKKGEKNSGKTKLFSFLSWIYGLTTLWYMWEGPKNPVIWTLFSLYMCAILFTIFMGIYIFYKYNQTFKKFIKERLLIR